MGAAHSLHEGSLGNVLTPPEATCVCLQTITTGEESSLAMRGYEDSYAEVVPMDIRKGAGPMRGRLPEGRSYEPMRR